MKKLNFTLILLLCISTLFVKAQVVWDFEDDEDHGFILWSVEEATPADDNPDVAGDEAITGVGGNYGLPDGGVAWTIGPPDQFDGLTPAFVEGCHSSTGVLVYGPCNDPFGHYGGAVNERGQLSYLNTYNLSQWGDDLHLTANDQIATSPVVLLGDNAMLSVWSLGGGDQTVAPKLEGRGYIDMSSGIAVLSAEDRELYASLHVSNHGDLLKDSLDLSEWAGEKVIIEVVDAFQGAWGWLSIDEISISNSSDVTGIRDKSLSMNFELSQNFPNPFNNTTRISYSLKENSRVEINVFDITGKNVANLVDQNQGVGNYSVVWDASEAGAGVYFYTMKTDGYLVSKKMTLLR